MELRQVYVSGALTNSNHKPFYEAIGHVLNKLGYSSYIPHQFTDPVNNKTITPKEVYEKDMLTIDASSFLVAWLGSPSLGVGAELERANSNHTPIVVLYPFGTHISNFVLGLPCIYKVIEYKDERSALFELYHTFSQIHKVFPFYNVPIVEYRQAYYQEMLKLETSKNFRAWVGEPSFEVGMKLEHANLCNIPTSLVHQENALISRLILGCPCVSQHIIADSMEEI